MKGKVKWFNRTKGYGFIEGEDGKDYFVHHTSLKNLSYLNDGQDVEFDTVETERGMQAQNVVLA